MLFIGGHNRSGSTLLSRLLGQQRSAISVGELTFIGDRGFRDNQLCSCGEPFRACSFWSEVVKLAAGPSPHDWFARLTYLKHSIARIRYVPALALGRESSLSPITRLRVTEYIEMLGEVIAAVAAVANTNLVIDSSKHPPYGFLLSKSDAFELYPVHLVRDCRAVAFSQQRKRVRPEIYWATAFMPRFSPARTAFDWALFNSLMHLLGEVAGRYRRVRYEDIVASPERVSRALLDWAAGGCAPRPTSEVGEHQLSGNPMRLKREFEVTPDVEWLDRMSTRDKAAAAAISAPFLLKYGYKLRSPRAAHSARPSAQPFPDRAVRAAGRSS